MESCWLQAVPEWVGQMTRLRSLAVGAYFGQCRCGQCVDCNKANLGVKKVPGAIGKLVALKELRLQGLECLKDHVTADRARGRGADGLRTPRNAGMDLESAGAKRADAGLLGKLQWFSTG